MSVLLINPNLVYQKSDPFTTGIVYMPVSLAYFAGTLRGSGIDVQVLDVFAERPNQHFVRDGLVFRGLTPTEAASRVPPGTRAAVVYAGTVTAHESVLELLRRLRSRHPGLPLVVMENTQAVSAYAIRSVQEDLFRAGATHLLAGEPEIHGTQMLKAILAGQNPAPEQPPDSASARPDLDQLPLPAWDLFPLPNYWNLRYAHGPQSSLRYLPILTSRGCPYSCRFCVIPATTGRHWRGRSACSVVDEMEQFVRQFGVKEFHVEDVDPTVNDERTRALCREIIARGLSIVWKLCSGTKAETIRNEDTLDLLAQAGCRYISVSPETGSPKVVKLINKPIHFDHIKTLIKKMNALGIRSQACFLVGMPGEEAEDRDMTAALVQELSAFGVDEIAVFIMTPVPGSELFSTFSGYGSYSRLTFSPVWRNDYPTLSRFRLRLYRTFLWTKLTRHFLKMLPQAPRFLARRFETKMEMVPYRVLHMSLMQAGVIGRKVAYEFEH